MFWVIFALLTGAAVFSVLWPLSRAPRDDDARELDVAFYKAQTAEIERDTTRGVIGREEAKVAQTEAARRLVSAAARDVDAPKAASPWVARAVALASLVFVPTLAYFLYRDVGAPGMPDDPLQARLNAPPGQLDIAAALVRIEQHLAKNPDDRQGWAILAPIYVRLQRFEDAARAYTNLIRTAGPTADRYAILGEVQMSAADGTVTPQAKQSFEEALKLEPTMPRAQFYLGLAAEQAGDKGQAVAIWRKLEAASPADAPWLPTVRNHIAAATGAPMTAPMAAGAPSVGSPPESGQRPSVAAVAAMAPDQQQAMIHRMVDGLAARLKSNGQDIDGWLRLVRAYRVLNEDGKAKDALSDAKHAFAADPTATQRLDALAHELGLEG